MSVAKTIAIWVGGGALLAATAIDTFAVIGRQIGLPLRGAIELIQAAVLVAGCIALVLATHVDRHARVPWLWLRLFANISLVIVSALALRSVFARRAGE